MGIIAVDLASPAAGLAALFRAILRGRLVIDEGFAGRLEEFLRVVLEVNWCAAELIFIAYGLVRVSQLTH